MASQAASAGAVFQGETGSSLRVLAGVGALLVAAAVGTTYAGLPVALAVFWFFGGEIERVGNLEWRIRLARREG